MYGPPLPAYPLPTVQVNSRAVVYNLTPVDSLVPCLTVKGVDRMLLGVVLCLDVHATAVA